MFLAAFHDWVDVTLLESAISSTMPLAMSRASWLTESAFTGMFSGMVRTCSWEPGFWTLPAQPENIVPATRAPTVMSLPRTPSSRGLPVEAVPRPANSASARALSLVPLILCMSSIVYIRYPTFHFFVSLYRISDANKLDLCYIYQRGFIYECQD